MCMQTVVGAECGNIGADDFDDTGAVGSEDDLAYNVVPWPHRGVLL